jgi:hypothetical protein
VTVLTQLTLWQQEQRFFPYWMWEDFKAGMYKQTKPDELDGSVAKAVVILGDAELCESSMRRCVNEWKHAASENLSDATKNRRPWLGRACCCIQAGVRDDAVRIAWWQLTEEQRDIANKIADMIIREWEKQHA